MSYLSATDMRGGYGRAEMAPQSDVDLLFLTPWKITGWAESVVESMLYMLWDLKLKVGQSTRTIDDCIRLGGGDITIRTSLLEHRLVCGHAATAETLRDRLWSDLFDNSVPEFIEAKLAERAERHRRQGGPRNRTVASGRNVSQCDGFECHVLGQKSADHILHALIDNKRDHGPITLQSAIIRLRIVNLAYSLPVARGRDASSPAEPLPSGKSSTAPEGQSRNRAVPNHGDRPIRGRCLT